MVTELIRRLRRLEGLWLYGPHRHRGLCTVKTEEPNIIIVAIAGTVEVTPVNTATMVGHADQDRSLISV